MNALIAFLLAAAPATAPTAALPVDTVPDAELRTMRGGFALPGGLDIAVAVQTDTAVNGQLVLRTVFVANAGQPSITAFVPADAASRPGPGTTTGAGSGESTVTVNRAVDAAATPAGLVQVALAPGAAPAATAAGAISEHALPSGSRVLLQGTGFEVSHLLGGATGAAVANSMSDRVIDTATNVRIDISGATPATLGSAMFRAEDVALNAVRDAVH